jgi:hypothetical protein
VKPRQSRRSEVLQSRCRHAITKLLSTMSAVPSELSRRPCCSGTHGRRSVPHTAACDWFKAATTLDSTFTMLRLWPTAAPCNQPVGQCSLVRWDKRNTNSRRQGRNESQATSITDSTLQLKQKAKLSLCLTTHCAIKAYGGVDVWIHVLLSSALVAASPQGKSPRYPWIAG